MQLAKTYTIETNRLIIRCYQPQDAPLLKQAIDESIDHLKPWMPWAKQEPETVEMKANRLRRYRGQFDLGEDYTFGIFNKSETMLIGSTGLHTRTGEGAREIGYWIHATCIGKGYATETVQALTKIGFEIEELERIEIKCEPENIRSQNIPRKLGFTHEATLKKRYKDVDGSIKDSMIWTLFKDQYKRSDMKDIEVKAYDILGNLIPFQLE